MQRYEHAATGDLLHLDIKKLGRIVRPGHRITGDPRDYVDGAGWECVHVAIDDHSRVGFSQGHPDETAISAIAFLHIAVAYYASLGVTIRRLLTDNGSAYRSKAFAMACAELHQTPLHAALHPTHQRQGRAIHTDRTTRVGVCHQLCNQRRTSSRSATVDARLQSSSTHSALDYRPPITRIPQNNLSNFNT